ncbi:hypothetical protein, partial [Ruminococcus sp.]|uniref:hypothetical protein n=1 Tax=Ruminococcus sp. TaxID=41978 RepID=UPI00386B89D9
FHSYDPLFPKIYEPIGLEATATGRVRSRAVRAKALSLSLPLVAFPIVSRNDATTTCAARRFSERSRPTSNNPPLYQERNDLSTGLIVAGKDKR